jgi:membrane-bound lytic murein transglycosylase A
VLAGLGAVLAGCAPNPPAAPHVAVAPAVPRLRAVGFADLPGWGADDLSAALPPFRATCARFARMSPDARLGGAGEAATLGGTPAAWRPACAAVRGVPDHDPAAGRRFWETWFRPWQLGDSAGGTQGLFTGYYEPEVAGSRVRADGYATPLLARPRDLVPVDLGLFDPTLKGRHIVGRLSDGALVPYWDRAQIEAGALRGQRLELLWVATPWDAAVLQIQGSGRVRLADGQAVRVSFDGQNGRPYVPIGRVLAQMGAIPRAQVTMQSIHAWLAAHPDQEKAILDQDPSYVFFREVGDLRPDEGPPGALGALLTPGRSAAVDQHAVPLGAPLFVVTTDPLTGAPLRRMMQAQDVGGAIRGAVRADIFWGWGADAEARAGLMKQPGEDYVLLPRSDVLPSS